MNDDLKKKAIKIKIWYIICQKLWLIFSFFGGRGTYYKFGIDQKEVHGRQNTKIGMVKKS